MSYLTYAEIKNRVSHDGKADEAVQFTAIYQMVKAGDVTLAQFLGLIAEHELRAIEKSHTAGKKAYLEGRA